VTHLIGWKSNLPKQAKQCTVSAACTLACYDLGLEKVIGKQSIENWLKKIEVSVRFTSTTQIVKRGKDGPTAYTYLITDAHPIYMHELFR